jgi:hypothetical protein
MGLLKRGLHVRRVVGRPTPLNDWVHQAPTIACFVQCFANMKQVHYGGEDAYFVSDAGGGAIGVADGVGGWQESGVNPAGEA